MFNSGACTEFLRKGGKFLDPLIQGGENWSERGETLKKILFKHNFRGGNYGSQGGKWGNWSQRGENLGGISPLFRNDKVISPLSPLWARSWFNLSVFQFFKSTLVILFFQTFNMDKMNPEWENSVIYALNSDKFLHEFIINSPGGGGGGWIYPTNSLKDQSSSFVFKING